MKKLLIIPAAVIFGIIFLVMVYVYSSGSHRPKMSIDTNINITQNGRIDVVENVKISKHNSIPKSFNIPLAIEDTERWSTWQYPQNVTVILDGKYQLLESMQLTSEMKQQKILCYYISKDSIMLDNTKTLEKGEHTISITYSYSAYDVIDEYNNYATLQLKCRGGSSFYNIKSWNTIIKFNNNIESLKTEDALVSVERIDDKTFKVNLSMHSENSRVLFDTNKIDGTYKTNTEYDDSKLSKFKEKNEIEKYGKVVYFIIWELILLVILIILRRKPKIEKSYTRNPDDVISPVLAESIIDRKVNAKNLIMAVILELIRKGNLKNISNQKIQLIDYEDVTSYEKDILDILFTRKGEIVEFSEINKKFVTDNYKTKNIFKILYELKEKINNTLLETEIYSKLGERVLKTINWICLFNYIGIMITVLISSNSRFNNPIIILCAVSLAVLMWYSKDKLVYRRTKEGNATYYGLVAYAFVGVLVMILFMLQSILIPIAFLVNFIVQKKTRTHIYTEKGKQEYEKAMGLKAFLEDYSLMEERDMESVVLWDKYLSYSAAFGISNKVTNKFNEGMLNLNIALQGLNYLFF